jgi:hypothetical protein
VYAGESGEEEPKNGDNAIGHCTCGEGDTLNCVGSKKFVAYLNCNMN